MAYRFRHTDKPGNGLFQIHAIRVVRHGCGPVGEYLDNAHFLRKDIERLVHIAILFDRLSGGVKQIVKTTARRALTAPYGFPPSRE